MGTPCHVRDTISPKYAHNAPWHGGNVDGVHTIVRSIRKLCLPHCGDAPAPTRNAAHSDFLRSYGNVQMSMQRVGFLRHVPLTRAHRIHDPDGGGSCMAHGRQTALTLPSILPQRNGGRCWRGNSRPPCLLGLPDTTDDVLVAEGMSLSHSAALVGTADSPHGRSVFPRADRRPH